MTATQESAPMSVPKFLKRLDGQKLDAEVVRHDPAEAARVLRVLSREHGEMKALLREWVDGEGDEPVQATRALLSRIEGAK